MRAERAREGFLSGETCAQAVLSAFADALPCDAKTLKDISRPFGGGMGRLRLTCGALSGGVMALGLFFPDLPKSGLYALVQEYARRFRERFGSCVCGELLVKAGVQAGSSPQAEERTPAYYRKRPCPELVYGAAEILEQLLKEQGKLD